MSSSLKMPLEEGYKERAVGLNVSTAEAIMDLEQLEQLQEQAERMKGLGNKHMANQEYAKAYNAYSAALQLSPVGPNSHVFLSNRAAALLSLKKYAQAASDAQRSIGLSPEFSKAHARLGQALYFLKDYEGAVRAYESATQFDPDNRITIQYLEKARRKLIKQTKKVGFDLNANEQRNIDTSEKTTLSPTQFVSQEEGIDKFHRDEDSMSSPSLKVHHEVIRREFQEEKSSPYFKENPKESLTTQTNEEEEEGHDLIEARKLYEKGNQLLEMKEYRYAIDEFSAALFLCPDHPLLSFQLCVGRANAHNHSKRHEAAANDARMAIGIRPDLPHGYSLLGRSLFYLKDYAGTVIALEESMRLMQPHEEPNVFDKAYLAKAQDSLAASSPDDVTATTAATAFTSMTLRSTYTTSSKNIPKLKPPRFVSREQTITKGSTLPPMPSAWPAQSTIQTPFRLGKERDIFFGAGPLGIKLNRGCDGFVRVLSTYTAKKNNMEAKAIRRGEVFPGDIVREAAGVDLRRPLTNVMWGDTVALIKMAPRPLKLIVAKELSTPPPQVLEELGKAAAEEMELMLVDGVNVKELRNLVVPTPVCGDDAVADFVEKTKVLHSNESNRPESVQEGKNHDDEKNEDLIETKGNKQKEDDDNNSENREPILNLETNNLSNQIESMQLNMKEKIPTPPSSNQEVVTVERVEAKNITHIPFSPDSNLLDDALVADDVFGTIKSPELEVVTDTVTFNDIDDNKMQEKNTSGPANSSEEIKTKISPKKSNDTELLGGEILFDIDQISSALPIIPWSATETTRKLIHHSHVLKLKKSRFWGEKYVPRILALYRHPSLILVLRKPENVSEVKKLLDLPRRTKIEGIDGKKLLDSYLVAESVIDLTLSKLRLSPLTTVTSVYVNGGTAALKKMQHDPRRETCFEIITPTDTHLISLDINDEQPKDYENVTVETSCWETAITYDLHNAHKSDPTTMKNDQGWKHQIVLGTLHSHVILGDIDSLEMALSSIHCKFSQNGSKDDGNKTLVSKNRRTQHTNLNMRDDDGWSPLHYACSRRAHNAVSLLLNAGADCRMRTPIEQKTPCHLSAEVLDDKSLSYLLGASSGRPDPNALDKNGYTPMRLAAIEGTSVGGTRDPVSLKKCLSALEAWGGLMITRVENAQSLREFVHPVAVISSRCRAEDLDAVLSHCQNMFPLSRENSGEDVSSLEAKYDFPIHVALISLRKYVLKLPGKSSNIHSYVVHNEIDKNGAAITRTIQVLLDYGFEPNQRISIVQRGGHIIEEINALYGFTPLQILALASLEAHALQERCLRECNEDEKLFDGDKSKRIIKQTELIIETIVNVTEILVKYGGRINVAQPPSILEVNDEEKNDTDSPLESIEEENSNLNELVKRLPTFLSFNRTSLKCDGNKKLLKFLGGMERISACQTQWSIVQTVNGTGKIILHQKSDFKKSESSSTERNKEVHCAICWKSFGRLLNRKHTCRVSGRCVCDECSSKRICEGGEDFRVSDGLFSLARNEAVKEKSRAKQVEFEKRKERKARLAALQTAKYKSQNPSKTEVEETEKKRELFGSNIGKGLINFIVGEDDEVGQHTSTQTQLDGLASSLGQTKDALNVRGEKLNTLSEKTSALADQSREFAELAKQLRQDQEKGIFSLFS